MIKIPEEDKKPTDENLTKEDIDKLNLGEKEKEFVKGCEDSGGKVTVNEGIITCKIKTKEMDEPVDLVKVKDDKKGSTLVESNEK